MENARLYDRVTWGVIGILVAIAGVFNSILIVAVRYDVILTIKNSCGG